jgi:hypothetical protein
MNVNINSAIREYRGSSLKYIGNILTSLPNGTNYFYPNASTANQALTTPIEDVEGLTINDAGLPFKKIYVPESTQTVVIIGIDGNIAKFELTKGIWDFGGIGLKIEDMNPVTTTDEFVFLY